MKKIFRHNNIIIGFAAVLLAINMFFVGVNTLVQIQKLHKPIIAPGFPYADLKEKLRKVKHVGYLTNKDMSPEHNDGEFLRAQNMLAPTILDFNNADHPWTILNYTHESFVLYTLDKIGAVPIYANRYGKVLAVKKP